jgi:hypothetical protein
MRRTAPLRATPESDDARSNSNRSRSHLAPATGSPCAARRRSRPTPSDQGSETRHHRTGEPSRVPGSTARSAPTSRPGSERSPPSSLAEDRSRAPGPQSAIPAQGLHNLARIPFTTPVPIGLQFGNWDRLLGKTRALGTTRPRRARSRKRFAAASTESMSAQSPMRSCGAGGPLTGVAGKIETSRRREVGLGSSAERDPFDWSCGRSWGLGAPDIVHDQAVTPSDVRWLS